MVKKPGTPTVEQQFIEHLKSEIAYLRGDNAFLKGKCERLELAVLQPKGIDHFWEKPAPIESVKMEAQPKANSWQKAQQEWNSLTEDEQLKRLGGTQ
jgi:hypothetical protein